MCRGVPAWALHSGMTATKDGVSGKYPPIQDKLMTDDGDPPVALFKGSKCFGANKVYCIASRLPFQNDRGH